jgi:adenylate cyclase
LPAGSQLRSDDLASLLVHLPGKLVARVDIGSVPFTIGRGHGNGLMIEEKEISRRHALIDRAGGHYVIEDLNSRNGVLVNGKRRELANLKSGDVINIGGVKLVFHLKDELGDDTGEHGEVKANNVIAFGETQRLPDDATPDDELGTRKAKD